MALCKLSLYYHHTCKTTQKTRRLQPKNNCEFLKRVLLFSSGHSKKDIHSFLKKKMHGFLWGGSISYRMRREGSITALSRYNWGDESAMHASCLHGWEKGHPSYPAPLWRDNEMGSKSSSLFAASSSVIVEWQPRRKPSWVGKVTRSPREAWVWCGPSASSPRFLPFKLYLYGLSG